MPVADELAALRARGTVKATSSAISSKETTNSYVFTTPQEQELLRKQKAKQEKIAREQAEKYLRKHNAGGINDLWYKKLKELKARKRAGARVAWTKKDKADGAVSGDEVQEEDVGLDVEMLPEHLVKALKAKYETENAEEALNKALKEEEEGKGTILSEVMADLDGEEDNVEMADTQNDEACSSEKSDEVNVAAAPEINAAEPRVVKESNEVNETTDEAETTESAQEEKDSEAHVEDEPVEEVRSKIEQLSIEDSQSKLCEEENAPEDNTAVDAEDASKELKDATVEQSNDETVSAAGTESKEQANLFYNVQSKQFFTGYECPSDNDIDLTDLSQRGKLGGDQNAQIKEQLLALQEQVKDILASW